MPSTEVDWWVVGYGFGAPLLLGRPGPHSIAHSPPDADATLQDRQRQVVHNGFGGRRGHRWSVAGNHHVVPSDPAQSAGPDEAADQFEEPDSRRVPQGARAVVADAANGVHDRSNPQRMIAVLQRSGENGAVAAIRCAPLPHEGMEGTSRALDTIISIDPGASGGIAVYKPGQPITAHAMPKAEGDVLYLLRDLTPDPAKSVAFIKSVGGYVGKAQPACRAFTFGRGFGFSLGVL